MKKQPLFWNIISFIVWCVVLCTFLIITVIFSENSKINWFWTIILYHLVFALPLAFFIFFSNRSALARLSWLVVLLLPFIGILTYILFGRLYPHRFSHDENIKFQNKFASAYETNFKANVENQLKTASPSDHKLLEYMSDLTHKSWYPLVSPSNVQWIFDGNDYLENLYKDLMQAKKSIYLEFYTIADSEIFDGILAILKDRIKEGVKVYILIDGGGSFLELPLSKRLLIQKMQIKLSVFFPAVRFMFGSRTNYRLHRKIVVIDNVIGYYGGFNIADEYNNKSARFGHWHDANLKIIGDPVFELTKVFHQDFNFANKKTVFPKLETPKLNYHVNSSEVILISDDGPNDNSNIHLDAVSYGLNLAKNRIWITTPYFVLDEEMFALLKAKALEGLDIRVIIPGIPDKKTVYRVIIDYCLRLKHYGVRIFTLKNSFLHSKLILIDDKLTYSGTNNFDIRSFHQCFELLSVAVSPTLANQVTTQFKKYFAKSVEQIPVPRWTLFQFTFAWLWKILTPIY